jgi:two-component system sensor histidine kinase BarA
METNERQNKPKLLITEDDIENQKFLQMFLKRKFDVRICDSGKSFYEKINEEKIDIILMDISLKGNKNGLELTKEIRKISGYENIPIVCLSAHAFKKDRDNALEAGVDIFLTKPVENSILMNSLLESLENRKQGNEPKDNTQ